MASGATTIASGGGLADRYAAALYAHAEVGRDIPAALFNAVAEVLAWVYNLRRAAESGGEAPRAPAEVPVPRGMDPEAGVAR